MARRIRLALFGLLLILLAATVFFSVQKTQQQEHIWKTALLERSPAYLHSERMQIAAAQAAMDALGMASTQSRDVYQADYQTQRSAFQANWMGLERLAADDPMRQGLLKEVRSSRAVFLIVLDQMAVSTLPPSATEQSNLKASLDRVESAMANYSASLAQSAEQTAAQPVTLWFQSIWFSLILLLAACAVLLIALEYLSRKKEKQIERFRLQSETFNKAAAILLVSDMQGRIVQANPAAMLQFGWDSMIPPDTHLSTILAPGEYDRLLNAGKQPGILAPSIPGEPKLADYFHSADAPGLPVLELQFQQPDGNLSWMLCTFSSIDNSKKIPDRIVCAAIDTTARHRAETSLRESEQRYRELCEHTQEMLAVVDYLGRYRYMNAAGLRCMEKSSEQVIGSSFESVFPLEQQAAAAALLRKAMHGQPSDQRTLVLRRLNGSELELEVVLAVKHPEKANPIVHVAFRDITDRLRRERRLAMQVAIGRTIATTVSMEALLPELLYVFSTHLHADFVDLWTVQGQPPRLRRTSQYSRQQRTNGSPFRSTAQDVLAEGEELPGRIMEKQAAVWIEDIAQDQSLQERQRLAADGIISAWGVPIRVDNQLLATLQFYHRRKRLPDFELVTSVEQVCAFLGQYLIRSAEQAETQRILHQSDSILRSVADGIFVFDAEGRITFANPAAARFFSIPQSMLIGRSLHSTLHADIDEPCDGNCSLQQALRLSEVSTDEDIFSGTDGSLLQVRFSLTPLIENDKPTGGVLSFHPIESRRSDDPEASSMLAALAEEFRNPLEKIRRNLELLAVQSSAATDLTAAGTLETTFASVSQLLQFAKACIELEHVQSERFSEPQVPCDILLLAQQAAGSLQPVAQAARVELQILATPVTLPVVAPRILQVFLHIFNRAINVSPPGSRISVLFDNSVDFLHIFVIDQGGQAASEILDRNLAGLSPDMPSSDSADATTIALALCRVIVRQHGGRIWAERSPNHGATVHLRLPHKYGRNKPN